MINRWVKRLWAEYNGEKIYIFSFKNKHNSYVEVLNYGAIVKSIVVPDKDNNLSNVVLNYPDFISYKQDPFFVGATIGRFANRIGNASYTFDNQVVLLSKNDGPHQNHGGKKGFHDKIFDYYISGDTLVLSVSSPSGEGGYPGHVQFIVRYKWSKNDQLSIKYEATTTQITPLNFTNHSYFNLSGTSACVWDHVLKINADKVLETSSDFIPTGEILPADLIYANSGKSLGEILIKGHVPQGLNHYFIAQSSAEKSWKSSAIGTLLHPKSGRCLEVYTSYPGVQIYTGDYLDTKHDGLSIHKPFQGVCLECQYYPDSPNHKNFPTTFIGPREHYHQQIIYSFKLMKDC